jgi:hypothetical protein
MKLYMECLSHTDNLVRYVDVLLDLLLQKDLSSVEKNQYIEELDRVLPQLKTPIKKALTEYFPVQVSALPRFVEGQDSLFFTLYVTNPLPRPVTGTLKLKLLASSPSGHDVWFTSGETTFAPGKHPFTVLSNITSPGAFIFDHVVLEWHSLSFELDFVALGRKQSVMLSPHGDALSVSARLARESWVLWCKVDV